MVDNQMDKQAFEQDDGIELIKIIDVLCKRKALIIFGTLAFMFLAGLIGYLLPSIYRIQTIVEVGTIEQKRNDGITSLIPIEGPETLIEKIKGKVYDMRIREHLHIEGNLPEIRTTNPTNTLLVEVVIDSSEKEKSLEILKTINNFIVADHLKLIEVDKLTINNRITQNENDISLDKKKMESIKTQLLLNKKNKEQIKKQIESVASRISDLEREKANVNRKANSDNTLSLLLFSNEIHESRRYYDRLQDKLNIDLEREAEDFNNRMIAQDQHLKGLMLKKEILNARLEAFRETRIVKEPTFSDEPVRPKRLLYMIFGGATGFIFLIILSFFLEYLQRFRARND